MDCETIQVSLASPYPGTELYDYVVKNGYLAVNPLLDESGYQKCTIKYPGLSNDEIYGAVERFYRSFYFRPRYIFKAVRKMMSSREECRRLLKRGRSVSLHDAPAARAGLGGRAGFGVARATSGAAAPAIAAPLAHARSTARGGVDLAASAAPRLAPRSLKPRP